MLNKLKRTAKEGTSKFIKAIAVIGTTLFITLNVNANPTSADVQKEIKEVFKKNPDKEIVVKVENNQSTEKTAKFEAVQDSIDALDFAVQNVDKYYPDMKEHLDTLLNSFRDQEQKDTVNYLFQQHIFKNIKDEKKQVASIIYCIESFVFDGDSKVKKSFSTTYKIGTIIAKEEYKYLFDFDKGYNKRFKGYYMKLEQTIITIKEQNEQMKQKNEQMKQKNEQMKQQNEQMKQQNEQMKQQNEQMKQQNEQMKQQNEQMKQQNEQMKQQNEQMKQQNEQMKKELEELKKQNEKLKKETEGIINTFTTNDVKNNPQIKKLVLDVEELYIFADYEIYPHLAELIKATKE